MALTYGFYNSISGDRRYNAKQMSTLFDGIIRDGVFATVGQSLMVSAGSDMTINVGTGRAWFNGTWTNNDAPLPLVVPPSETVLNRIDAVVLEVNETNEVRANSIKILKGTPATIPTNPTLTNSELVHQYPLAYIYVGANVSSIIQANITNKIGTTSTPFVTGILQTVTVEMLTAQWESEFDTWLDHIKDLFGDDPAGSLQNQIDELGAYAIADGTNSYTATINGYTLAEGKTIRIKFTNANTGASTLNINSFGAKSILKGNGNNLSSGNIKAGQICNLVYTGSVFQLLGEGGEYGTATASDVLQGKTIGTEDGLVSGTMPNRGTVTNTITTQDGSYTIPSGYHSGSGEVTASFSNLSAGNVKSGVNIGGVVGTYAPLAGYTWTQRTSSFGTTNIYGVCYGQGTFVAVGSGGKLATSTDGTTWTQRTSSFGTINIYGVCYGQGTFVAVGSGGKLATSTNGTTWTQRTSSFGTTNIYGVCYGQGMFVAVGDGGKLATSTNGTTWTQRTSNFGTSTIIRGVCYGQGMFVAVGDSGKLATSANIH